MDHTREHRSLLASAEKRLLVAIARRLPPWLSSDHLTLLGLAVDAGRGARLCEDWDRPLERDGVGAGPGRQLVRRQPRRHAGAGPRPAAPALRLLRRPRDRPRRRGGDPDRHGRLRADGAGHRARAARRIPARLGGGLSRDPHRRRVPPVVRRHRTDRTSSAARCRRLLCRGSSVGRRRRLECAAARRQRADRDCRAASSCSSHRPSGTPGRCIWRSRCRDATSGALPRRRRRRLSGAGHRPLAADDACALDLAAGDAGRRRTRRRPQLFLACALDLA